MSDKQMKELQNKVIDLKRFAFILLALSGFLSIGLVIPGAIIVEQQGMMIGLLVTLLLSAFYCHRSAMATRQKLYEEE
ncbi:MAG: YrhC family protein [Bacillus sp. (in: Bacteria)]|nr:YrhC family protein [Bacillus sp. (in: firmicutes)]